MAKPFVIALEEHYTDPQVLAPVPPPVGGRENALQALAGRLNDLGEVRLREMHRSAGDLICALTFATGRAGAGREARDTSK